MPAPTYPITTDTLDKLREWFAKHGSSMFKDADEWINHMSNVELLEALSWINEP